MAHYLVLTHQAGAALPEAGGAAAAAPAENSAAAPTASVAEAAAGGYLVVHFITCQLDSQSCAECVNRWGHCDRGSRSIAGAQSHS